MVDKKLHNLLQRQIRRHLKLDPDSLPKEWDHFIKAVNDAYVSSDDDRKMLERTMELSSKELLQTNSEMGEIYKAFPDQFFRLDKAGVILSYNAGRSSDTFSGMQSLLGKKMQDIPVFDVREKFKAAIQSIQAGEALVTIEYSMTINSKIEHYEARLVSLLEEQIFVIVRNITNRNRAREALLKAKEDAESANLTKSQFLANMSHELRTPLNVIIGYSELIKESSHDIDPEELKEDVSKIISSSKHLLELINDVLDLSKIEANKMDLQFTSFEIFPHLHDAVTSIGPLSKQNNNTINIICSEDIGFIQSDMLRLNQVLYNLLSNACKFTEHGVITIEVHRSSNGEVVYKVNDTGIGIPTEKLEILFDAFSQVDESSTRKHGGTGLGLSITKHFVEMMGGKIMVESTLGTGSKFTVHLPERLTDTLN
ncbi:MAG: hypothetical protein BMS9Abin31_0101 [Gammaproteobacteria bacterium]|nr:MAG: hypothetical protein BMS9Abin31_0101 [Gammaproteobacteria bacterium]